MKRGAEKQISRLDQISDDEETGDVHSEFKKADESTLASRKIRGLPKRTLVGSVPTTVNGTSTSESELSTGPSKFPGFAGFGASSPFTFTATTAKPSSALGSPPQPPETPSLAFSTTTVSTTASTTAKTLASFLGAASDVTTTQKLNPSTNATSLAFPLMPSSQTKSPPPPLSSVQSLVDSEPANESAVKYFTDLRGLNVSFVAALSKAMSEDPFADFSQLLEQYRSKRSIIQTEYDKTKKPEASSKETHMNMVESAKLKSPPSMPTPPTSFSFGGSTFGASSFKPTASNNVSGFKPSLLTTTDGQSSSKFGSTSTQQIESSNASSNDTISKPLSFGSTTPALPFGAKSDLPNNPFKFPASTPTAGGTAPTFGGSSLFGQQFNSTPVAKPSSTSSSAFNVFGKPSGGGSIGNPVGFGFGANTGSSEDADTKHTPSSGLVFGQPPSSPFGRLEVEKVSKKVESNDDVEEEAAGTDGSGATEGDEAAKVGVSSPTSHDVEGEGEEEEETMHSVRLKAHRMKKADEKGGTGWLELGVGYLRLKRHKGTEARRMLLRNSSTGKININFKLYPGFKVTQTKKSLTFIGHDNGVAQTYNVRLPNEDQVRELKAAIEREVALIKEKD